MNGFLLEVRHVIQWRLPSPGLDVTEWLKYQWNLASFPFFALKLSSLTAKPLSDFGWTANDGSACWKRVKTAMREDQASKRGTFALNSRRIFSRFGGGGGGGEVGAGKEGEAPGVPEAGVGGVIGLTVSL